MRESEERFRKVFDEGPLGMALVQPDHHFTRVNKTFCTMLGYSEEELTILKFTEITHPDDIKLGVELTQKLYRGEIPSFSVEKRYMKKNGEVLQARLIASLFRDMKGHPVYSIAMIEDITERKRAEESLRESESKYRSIFENSIDGILLTYPDGRVGAANPAACQILGRTEEEICASGRYGVTDPADPRLPAAVKERARTGRFSGELTHKRKDGTKFPAEISTSVFKDRDGREMTSMVIRDITERNKVDAALKESEEKYRTLVEQSLQGIMIGQGFPPSVVFVNPAMAKMLGYTHEELTSLSPKEIEASVYPEDRVAFFDRFSDRLQGEPPPSNFEFRAIRKDGEIRWMEVSANRIKYQGQPAVQATFIDIDERKRAEETLEQSRVLLRSVIDSQSDLIWSIDAPSLRLLMYNQAFVDYYLQVLGIRVENGMSPDDLLPTDDLRKQWHEFYQRAVREGSFEIEYRMQTSKRTLQLSFNVLARDRTVFGISVFAKDITERKKADEALRESEERFRRITENMMDMVTQTDVQGICQYASPSFKTILGYEPKSMLGKSLFELVHPEDLNGTLEIALKALATRSTAKFDYRYKHADGHYVWLQSVGNPLFDLTGQISGTVLVTRDITERIEYETRLQALHTHASQLSSTKDIDAVVKHTLDAMEVTLGFEHADFLLVENNALQMKGRRGIPVTFSAQPLNGRGLTVKAANTKTTLRIPDTRKEPAYVDPKGYDWTGPPTVLSELIVPVRYRRRSGCSPMRRQHANRQLQRGRSETSRNISDTRRVSASTLETRRGA